MRILLIEDDVETAQFLQKALKESGHTTDVAHDGDDGIALAREGGHDVLIVDRMLPKQDGLTIVSQVVQTTTLDIASLQAATHALALAIHDTNPVFTSLSQLTGADLPTAISATQTSLACAQGSALLIDNVLAALTNIPFPPRGCLYTRRPAAHLPGPGVGQPARADPVAEHHSHQPGGRQVKPGHHGDRAIQPLGHHPQH